MLDGVSNSSLADVELDTIQTLWFCLFIVRPLPILKETTKGFFIEGRAVADRSAASFSREAWGMSSSKYIYLEIISCLLCASLTHQICSVTHHLFIMMRWLPARPKNKISHYSPESAWLENIFWFWYWGWATLVCHDLEWKTSDKPTDLPLPTSWLAWVVPGPCPTAGSSAR